MGREEEGRKKKLGKVGAGMLSMQARSQQSLFLFLFFFWRSFFIACAHFLETACQRQVGHDSCGRDHVGLSLPNDVPIIRGSCRKSVVINAISRVI